MVEIDFDLYRKYLPYIAEAMMRNGVMANDIEQIYAQSEANYYSLCSKKNLHRISSSCIFEADRIGSRQPLAPGREFVTRSMKSHSSERL